MEISIAMILHSRVPIFRINRWVNNIVGVLTIAFIWGDSSYPDYLIIATVETFFLVRIVGFVWR